MNKKKQEKFRKRLHEELERLIQDASITLNGMTHEKALFPDPTDRAALEADRNFLLRIRDRERKLILKIREALSRIDDGTFGICEKCGGGDLREPAHGETRRYALRGLQATPGAGRKARGHLTSSASGPPLCFSPS